MGTWPRPAAGQPALTACGGLVVESPRLLDSDAVTESLNALWTQLPPLCGGECADVAGTEKPRALREEGAPGVAGSNTCLSRRDGLSPERGAGERGAGHTQAHPFISSVLTRTQTGSSQPTHSSS